MPKLPVQISNILKVSKSIEVGIDTYVSIPEIGIKTRYRKVSILQMGIVVRYRKVLISEFGIETGNRRKVFIPEKGIDTTNGKISP